ncbi:MAG: DUF4838 domain-containing protein [Clostridia bacterium]|nr:DUF4838 domain-containing protein [Clostridia bacterium]
MHYKGIVIHPDELSNYWLDRLEGTDINFLGIHPVGKSYHGETVAEAVEWVQKPETQQLLQRAEAMGIAVEYEMHALNWLIPRELFAEHPDWFRMNENGERVADYNCCPSNPEVLEYLADRAAELAGIFKTSSGRYHFWTDDVPEPKCHCPKCRELTASDEAVLMYNAMNKGVRRAQPDAGVSYLAYDIAIDAPEKVKPDEGIFLEFAPMKRNTSRAICDPESEMNKQAIAPVGRLLEVFGHKNAQVLEYWLDNSWFSGWARPMKRFDFPRDIVALDSAWYDRAGFETMTCFACYLGEEYHETTGDEVDIEAYSQALGILAK